MQMREYQREQEVVLEAAFEVLRPDEDGRGIVPELDELSLRRRVRDIVDTFEQQRDVSTNEAHGKRRLVVGLTAVAAVTLLLVAAGFLWLSRAPRLEQPMPKPAPSSVADHIDTTRIPGSRIAMVIGDVLVGDEVARLGESLSSEQTVKTSSGQTAVTLPSGIGVGLFENTAAQVFWDGKTRYRISLLQGMALFSVDPSQARDGFFVDTPVGTVHVKGTLFTVVVSKEAGVFVQLHRGQIAFEKPGRSPTRIASKRLVRLDSLKKRPPSKLKRQVLGQLHALRCMDDEAVFSELSHFDCLQEQPFRKKTTASVSRRPHASGLSLKALMRRARNHKSDGNWRGAAASYKTVIKRFPKSNEAMTARVALAQIQLRRLNKPEAALSQFSKYLVYHGPLAQEALFGKAEAYRMMGRRQQERQALSSYLAKYPRGMYAKPAKTRLDRLQGH